MRPPRGRAAALPLAVVCALLVTGCSVSPSPRAEAPPPTTAGGDGLVDIGAGLHGMPGLRASVVATGLDHLAALSYDAHGRLWAATADAADQGDDAVYLIGDSGPAAVIPGLHTPMGLLSLDDDLYVASTGRVDAYSGFDGTRFTSSRPVVDVPGGGTSGQLVAAPDGRIQLGVSAPCDSCTPSSPWAAVVVSFRPDGSDLRVDASGIRAPVGLVYAPGTTDLLVTMNQRDDLGGATPGDWLAVVRPGQAWGFPGCYGQGGEPCTGVPAPLAVLDKHAAVSGVAVAIGSLGPSVGTSALVAEWALGKVVRVPLPAPGGAASSPVPFLSGFRGPPPGGHRPRRLPAGRRLGRRDRVQDRGVGVA